MKIVYFMKIGFYLVTNTEEHKDYFIGASHIGKLFSIDNLVWLVREPTLFINEDGKKEIGWDANCINDIKCSYHFFTESELKDKNIKEFNY